MSRSQLKVSSYLQSTIPSLLLRSLRVAGHCRNQIIGTITLTALLVTIFQIEVIIASSLGFPSSMAMLDAIPRNGKVILAAVVGPFLHQGPSHLIGSLGVLLVAGAYLEYEYDSKYLYLFYLCIGFLAAWAPLTMGSVGAVGASGVTFGLTSWLLIHSIIQPLEMTNDTVLDHRILHALPIGFGLVKTGEAVAIINSTIDGADDITHLFGAFLGLVWGAMMVLSYHRRGINEQ